jgi:hypothetical protein
VIVGRGQDVLRRLYVGLVLAAAFFWPGAASAQFGLSCPLEPPAEIVRGAMASRYAGLLMEEFAKAVMASADRACLDAKGLDAAKLKDRGTDLFQRWGTRIMERIGGNIDMQRFDAALAARAGANAKEEMARLRREADVQRYLALERPLRLAKVLDFVVEQFDRYVLITRVKLNSFAPLATGNERLLRASQRETREEALERRQALGRKSPQMERFLKLSEAGAMALQEAFNRDTALLWGPTTFYRGVEADLAEICI